MKRYFSIFSAIAFAVSALGQSGDNLPAFSGAPIIVTATTPVNGTNEIQTITLGGTPTGGTFRLTFDGHTTAAITWTATDATLVSRIDSALEALPNIGTSGVTTAAGTVSSGIGTVTVTFVGNNAKKNVALMTGTSSLTGSSPTLAIATTTAGVTADGRTAPTGQLLTDIGTPGLYQNTSTTPMNPTWTIVPTTADAVTTTLFDANTMLYATTDNTPVALTVGASTFVGRKSTGDISAMSVAQALTELGGTTGTGALVRVTSPTMVTPVLGAASATTIAVSGASTLTGGIAGGVPRNAGTWPVNSATAGTDTACSNGTAYVGSVFLGKNSTVTGIQYLVGSVGGTDKVVVSLHDSTGALLANSDLSGTTVGTAAHIQQVAFTGTYAAVGPGTYFIGLTFNGTTAKFRSVPVDCNVGNGVIGNGVTQTFGTAASFTAPTTFTADKVPVASLY